MIGLIRRLQPIIPRSGLLTFISTALDLTLIMETLFTIRHLANLSLESFQYNAALEITGAIRDSSREKLSQELSIQPL